MLVKYDTILTLSSESIWYYVVNLAIIFLEHFQKVVIQIADLQNSYMKKIISIPMLYFHIKKAVRSKSTITIPFKFQATHYRGWLQGLQDGHELMDTNSHPGKDPHSKIHGNNMGTIWADRTQVGPTLAPWILLSGDVWCILAAYDPQMQPTNLVLEMAVHISTSLTVQNVLWGHKGMLIIC